MRNLFAVILAIIAIILLGFMLTATTLGWRATFTIGYVITGAGAVMPPRHRSTHFHRAHLLSALVVHTWSGESLVTTL